MYENHVEQVPVILSLLFERTVHLRRLQTHLNSHVKVSPQQGVKAEK